MKCNGEHELRYASIKNTQATGTTSAMLTTCLPKSIQVPRPIVAPFSWREILPGGHTVQSTGAGAGMRTSASARPKAPSFVPDDC